MRYRRIRSYWLSLAQAFTRGLVEVVGIFEPIYEAFARSVREERG